MKKLLLLTLVPVFGFASVSNGPYAGLEAGVSNQIDIFNSSTAYNQNNSPTYASNQAFLMRLNAGYNFSKYSGLELGGTYNFGTSVSYPNSSAANMNIQATTLDFSWLLYLPTTVDSLFVFGRVGGAYDWLNGSGGCNCNGTTAPGGGAFTDVLGAGVKYNVTSKTSFRLEWISNGLFFPVGINNGSTNTASWTNQTFMLGFNLHF